MLVLCLIAVTVALHTQQRCQKAVRNGLYDSNNSSSTTSNSINVNNSSSSSSSSFFMWLLPSERLVQLQQQQDARTDSNVNHVDVYRHEVYKVYNSIVAAATVAAAAAAAAAAAVQQLLSITDYLSC
eukprot:12108-Heterococcus_DN1.PRE.2